LAARRHLEATFGPSANWNCRRRASDLAAIKALAEGQASGACGGEHASVTALALPVQPGTGPPRPDDSHLTPSPQPEASKQGDGLGMFDAKEVPEVTTLKLAKDGCQVIEVLDDLQRPTIIPGDFKPIFNESVYDMNLGCDMLVGVGTDRV
jgi:hypothetical protein